jgi:hypothetical protein
MKIEGSGSASGSTTKCHGSATLVTIVQNVQFYRSHFWSRILRVLVRSESINNTDTEGPNFLHTTGLETLLLGTNFKQCYHCYGSASPPNRHSNFHVDPDWHQQDADPHADPTPSLVINFFICLVMIPIRIRQNYADPNRSASGSTTLVLRIVREKNSNRCHLLSVADTGCLSRILIFTHSGSRISDPGSRIPDPKTATKERGEKKICCQTFFCSHKFHKIVNNFIF